MTTPIVNNPPPPKEHWFLVSCMECHQIIDTNFSSVIEYMTERYDRKCSNCAAPEL